MMKLSKFLKELPGVRPRMAGRLIKGRLLLSPLAMDDLYIVHSQYGPVTLVGPDAGDELLALYKSGRLPTDSLQIVEPTPLIDKYLSNRGEFADEIRLRREIRDKAKDPDNLSDEDMRNWHILEHIFRDGAGDGDGQGPIEITGRLVSKIHSGRRGKATGADFTFQWEDDQGNTQIVEFELLQPTQRGYGEPKATSN